LANVLLALRRAYDQATENEEKNEVLVVLTYYMDKFRAGGSAAATRANKEKGKVAGSAGLAPEVQEAIVNFSRDFSEVKDMVKAIFSTQVSLF
jgi:hypothetical protein